ncbi:hypothetical protein GCM10009605_38380 [Nocardiopsis composta]
MFDQSRVPWSDGPGPAADRPRAPRGAARAETAPVHRAPPERGGGRGGPPGGQGALTSRPVLPDPEPLPSQVRAASPSPRKHSSAAGQPTKRETALSTHDAYNADQVDPVAEYGRPDTLSP